MFLKSKKETDSSLVFVGGFLIPILLLQDLHEGRVSN